MRPDCPRGDHLSRRALMKGPAPAHRRRRGDELGRADRHAGPGRRRSARQQKHCILLWMNGGASQFETFDMKPGRPTGGPFRPIATNVPGIADLRTDAEDGAADGQGRGHPLDADLRGRSPRRHLPDAHRLPPVGQRPLPRGRRDRRQVPGRRGGRPAQLRQGVVATATPGPGSSGRSTSRSASAREGGLPPFSVSRHGAGRGTAAARPAVVRRGPLRRARRRAKSAKMHREAYEAARRLQKGRDAFKIDAEWAKYRDLYGDSEFGKRCLLARRLVEAGVAFVEVGQSSYDSHADNFGWHRGLVPPMEHAWAGLLDRPEGARPARQDAGRVDRRDRPHAADQQPRRPRSLRPLLVHGPGRLRHQGRAGLRRVATRTASR